MNELTEEKIREIIRDEMRKNYMSGNPRVDSHSHNGTDNLNIDPQDLIGFSPIPTSTTVYVNESTGISEYGFASPQQLVGGSATSPSQFLHLSTIAQYPIPVVQGFGVGVSSAFNGGHAPDGTVVFFDNVSASTLWVRSNGKWRGTSMNLTA